MAERSVVVDELEKLLSEMARPIWVWRAARAQTGMQAPGRARGAETRRVNALIEIQDMLNRYAEGKQR